MPTPFAKRSAPLSFDKGLGLCFGWFAFSKKGGEPYIDAHGDHFPEDEFVKAVDALMARPAADREINVDHAGGARGVICTAYAVTEEIAKAHGWDTGGDYGIVGSFRPDAELLKSIQAGEMFCLSIEGMAHDVETIAKSADAADVAKAEHKRTMRKVDLTKLAVCKLGAHEGAAVAIIKTATDAARRVVVAQIAKYQPAMTTVADGHAHVISDVSDLDIKQGCTTWEQSANGSGYGHSHSWIRTPDGSIEIVPALGHSHALATTTATVENKMPPTPTADTQGDAAAQLAKFRSRIATAVALPADQAAYAKRLSGTQLDAFLDGTEAERATVAAPIHKSERTGRLFFKGDEALVEFAKDADTTHAELAKARGAEQAGVIAKSAAAIPHVKGAALITKAVYQLPEAERAEALAALATVDASLALVTKHVGSSGGDNVPENEADPKVVLEKAAQAFAKSNPTLSAIEARREFGRTEEGQRLYAAAYPTT